MYIKYIIKEIRHMKERNYWGYRIDTRARDFFNSELE